MALSKTLTLLRCRRDSARIAKVLTCLGERADAAVEGEMLILFVKSPLAALRSKKKPASRKRKTAAR